MRLNPASLQVGLGESAQVAVEVVNVQELYGFELQLGFDPQVVEVIDADPGRAGVQVSQGDFLDPGFIAVNRTDNESGVVEFAMTQLNPSEPASGSGWLVIVLVRGMKAGASAPLTLVHALLARRDGVGIPAALVPGSVEVTPPPGGPPADTPVFTPAPGITGTPPGVSQTAAPTPTSMPQLSATPVVELTTTLVPGGTGEPFTPLAIGVVTRDVGKNDNADPARTLEKTRALGEQALPEIEAEATPEDTPARITVEMLALGAALLLAAGAGVLVILVIRR